MRILEKKTQKNNPLQLQLRELTKAVSENICSMIENWGLRLEFKILVIILSPPSLLISRL